MACCLTRRGHTSYGRLRNGCGATASPTSETMLWRCKKKECVGIVGWIEEEELWRAGYESLDSFYQAYESRHPDIRVYAAVESEIAKAGDAVPLDERAEVIARRLAALRHSRQPGE